MATKSIMAARRLRTVNRVKELLSTMATALNVELPVIKKTKTHKAEVAHVFHLEEIEASLEALTRAVVPAGAPAEIEPEEDVIIPDKEVDEEVGPAESPAPRTQRRRNR